MRSTRSEGQGWCGPPNVELFPLPPNPPPPGQQFVFSEIHSRNLKKGPSAWDPGAALRARDARELGDPTRLREEGRGLAGRLVQSSLNLRGSARPSLRDPNRVPSGLEVRLSWTRRAHPRTSHAGRHRGTAHWCPHPCAANSNSSQRAAERWAEVEKRSRNWPGGGGLEIVFSTCW